MRLSAVFVLSAAAMAQQAVEGPRRCGLDRDYWVVRPASFAAQRPYTLVVLAHGFQQRGADILWLRRALARFEDCVFVAPSFPEGFQLLEKDTDTQVLRLAAQLRSTMPLRRRLFLCGFSAGAQFAHRFTMRHPSSVLGCAAHAGGTWGPVASPLAKAIPMALSCGLDDARRSSVGQALTRVQGAHRYFNRLVKDGYCVKARLFRGLGHATSPAVEGLIAECYALATRGTFPSGTRVGARSVRRVDLSLRERGVADVLFRDLGGRSADGCSYWIDDGRENADGWNVSTAFESQR